MHIPLNRSAVVAVLGGALVLAGCSSGGTTDVSSPAGSPGATSSPAAAHWTYEGGEGPEHWADLSGDFELCTTGTEQSPIDLSAAATVSGDTLELEYATIDDHVSDTGHTVQLTADSEASVEYNGQEYELVQMHYHDPSEHTIDGVAAPVEFHFVHEDDDGELLVVGVLGRESSTGADNVAFAPFIAATATASSGDVAGSIDLASLLPTSTDHFAYPGSLTTPPCTEGVQWIVMQNPVDLGPAQIDALQSAYAHNSRPVQPLGERTVTLAPTEVE